MTRDLSMWELGVGRYADSVVAMKSSWLDKWGWAVSDFPEGVSVVCLHVQVLGLIPEYFSVPVSLFYVPRIQLIEFYVLHRDVGTGCVGVLVPKFPDMRYYIHIQILQIVWIRLRLSNESSVDILGWLIAYFAPAVADGDAGCVGLQVRWPTAGVGFPISAQWVGQALEDMCFIFLAFPAVGHVVVVDVVAQEFVDVRTGLVFGLVDIPPVQLLGVL